MCNFVKTLFPPAALAFLLIWTPQGAAQTEGRVLDTNYDGWLMYFGDHRIKGRWGVHLEGQFRRHDVFNKWQQLLLRPAVNYHASENVTLTAGYGFVRTHPTGDFPVPERFPEHRIFQQVVLRNSAGKARFSHRFRLEQRYLGEIARDEQGERFVERWRRENRVRYMMRFTIPFQGRTIEKDEWYLAVYDEIFINFGSNVAENVYDRNRAYIAMGRDLGRIGRLELGYLNHLVQQRNGRVIENNHTVQIAFFSRLPFGE